MECLWSLTVATGVAPYIPEAWQFHYSPSSARPVGPHTRQKTSEDIGCWLHPAAQRILSLSGTYPGRCRRSEVRSETGAVPQL
jgi:hypothetical protein